MRIINLLFILPTFLITPKALQATYGKTFEIEEAPFGESFLNSDVDIEKMQEEHLEKIKDYVKDPPAVQGLEEAKQYRAFYYDPIFRIRETVKTLDGQVLAEEGQLINALDYPQLAKRSDLIFFDGSNEKHVEFAKQYPEAKWILVKGSPLDLEEAFDKDTYFDQNGMYCKQFGIERVPAKVSVEGRRILIEEIPCCD